MVLIWFAPLKLTTPTPEVPVRAKKGHTSAVQRVSTDPWTWLRPLEVAQGQIDVSNCSVDESSKVIAG